ncbi:MAG: hypothetical protein O2960_06015 [Verrucomicrobia bacterium]|nr:hypothetical protein [Verrucomicrobiota bacterium]
MERKTIRQVNIPEAIKSAEPRTWAHWLLEAKDVEGNELWARVIYNHSTRGAWQGLIVHPDGTAERLSRIPNIRAKRWIAWTNYAFDVTDAGRANA